MILLQRFRDFFLTIGLAVMLAVVIAFGFGSANSWAATLLTQAISQPPQMATMNRAKAMAKNLEGKAQEEIGDLTGDRQTQVAGQAKQWEGKTQKAIDYSIENPGYQPGGKTKQAERQDRAVIEDIEAQVREDFK
jgi:uncharacterized protein YjbJ (UPF0337 family)